MASQIHFSSWNRHAAAVIGTAVQQPPAESTKHTCVQGYMTTSCDRSQVKEVVGVVPLVLRDGKSSCSRGRRVKLESRQGGGPFFRINCLFSRKNQKHRTVNQIPFSSWSRHTVVVCTAVQQPSAESTKHTCAQGYMATACDRPQVKEVVGVVPLVLRDGKSS